VEHLKVMKGKKKKKTIISPKVDRLVMRVVEDEEDDLVEESVEIILKNETKEETS
jgi:hypothetical protein